MYEIPDYEKRLDALFWDASIAKDPAVKDWIQDAFSVNHPAMKDWIKIKSELQKLRKIAPPNEMGK